MIQYILPIILLWSMSISLTYAWGDGSCMKHTLSSQEKKQIQSTLDALDSYAYATRKDVLSLTHSLQQKVINSSLHSHKKCLIERALSDFESQVRITHSSHKNISKYILHPYYKNTYIPRLSENTLSNYIFKKWTSQNEVFLTFDDGPYNPNIIKYLKEEEVAGTFFLMCSRMNNQSLKPYQDPLFSLWWHTMYHDNYDELSPTQVIADIDSCTQVFEKLDIPHRIYRPAYGIINDAETKGIIKNNLTAYIWSIDSADWAWDFTIEKAREILDYTHPWDILLFHEWVDLEVFDFLVQGLREKWFSFWKL